MVKSSKKTLTLPKPNGTVIQEEIVDKPPTKKYAMCLVVLAPEILFLGVYDIHVRQFRFVVAASSPGRQGIEVRMSINSFRKSLGDGKWRDLYSCPLDLDFTEQYSY